MQHTFCQKLFFVVLAAALTAGVYVGFKKFIVGAESINAGYRKPGMPTITPTPAVKRRY